MLRIYFPKGDPIVLADKEVIFRVTYGSLKVSQRFRLKDLVCRGDLDL
jgi:hypothetical protein